MKLSDCCNTCGLPREALLKLTNKTLTSDAFLLDALLEGQGGKHSSVQSAALIMRSYLSIIHSYVSLSISNDGPRHGWNALAGAE